MFGGLEIKDQHIICILDNLPDLQYLFAAIDVENNTIETQFYLDNPDGISDELMELLKNHYDRLDLFRRFSDDADSVISSLKNIIEPLRTFHDQNETKNIVIESIKKERIAFGFNYWQSILKFELVNNDDFMINL